MRIALLIIALLFSGCSEKTPPYAADPAPIATVINPKSAPDIRGTAKGWLHFMIDKRPRYVMSDKIKPDDDIGVGVDCSRYGYLICKWSGIPVKRVTARDMAMGFGGWYGREIGVDEADELDFMWWTWKNKPNRPFGHIGYVLAFRDGLLGVTHASQSRGFIVHDKFEGILVRDLVRTKRMKFFE